MKTTMKSILLLIAFLLLMPMVVFGASTSLSFYPVNTFSGTAPVGSLTASFTDVTGGVELVINSSLASGENLDPSALYFNFNPDKATLLTNLSFAISSNTNFIQQATVNTGINEYRADGDGLYDILFTYLPSTKAFTSGQSQTYTITTSSGSIVATDFTNYLSSSAPGNGTTWLAAAHVQNTPSGGSGSAWVGATPTATTPIPAAAWLLGSGLLGLIGIKKRENS